MPLFEVNDRARIEELNTLIKIGEVSSIDPVKCTARVVFDDDDALVSYDLQVLQRNTYANHDYAMPDIGEDVICIFLPSGGEEGFILGSVYAGEITPPESDGNKRTTEFSDGTKITYDRAAHKLDISIGETKITADTQSVTVKAPQTVNVEGGQVVNIKGGASINLAAPSVNLTIGGTTMTLTGSQATISAQNLELIGELKVTGNVTTTGNITAAGHIHGN